MVRVGVLALSPEEKLSNSSAGCDGSCGVPEGPQGQVLIAMSQGRRLVLL